MTDEIKVELGCNLGKRVTFASRNMTIRELFTRENFVPPCGCQIWAGPYPDSRPADLDTPLDAYCYENRCFIVFLFDKAGHEAWEKAHAFIRAFLRK